MRHVALLSIIVGLVLPISSVASTQPTPAHHSLALTTRDVVVLSGAPIKQSSPAVADFNQDGVHEIVIGGSDGMLYVISRVNQVWTVVWSRQTAIDLNAAGAPGSSPCVTNVSDIRSAPAIGDLDGDGHLEIVVSVGGDPAQHRNGGVLVYRYNHAWSFTTMPGWPKPGTDLSLIHISEPTRH